jgi:hypothetical protein
MPVTERQVATVERAETLPVVLTEVAVTAETQVMVGRVRMRERRTAALSVTAVTVDHRDHHQDLAVQLELAELAELPV